MDYYPDIVYMEYFPDIIKENPATCDNMDELGGPYAKCNKPDRDKYYLISLYVECVKAAFTGESRVLVVRGWGEGQTGWCAGKRVASQLGADEF